MALNEVREAKALRAFVAEWKKNAPMFMRAALGDLPDFLDAWVASVEERIGTLQDLQSVGGNDADQYAAELARRQPPACEGCDE